MKLNYQYLVIKQNLDVYGSSKSSLIEKFENEIEICLNDGWQLVGGVACGDSMLYQALTRTLEEKAV